MFSQFAFLLLAALGAGGLAATTPCDADCRAKIASDWETKQHASADFSFYTAPSNFSSKLKPGSLLHLEPATNLSDYSIPSGLTMSRIIYTTTNLNGTVLPTSAYILWPYLPLNSASSSCAKDGYPMVAWAHGTSGLLKNCAPSNYRNLQYHFMVPFTLALQGMVVVAPDYAGLGIDSLPSGEHIGHPWAAGPAQANDLANAVLAARAAFPSFLKKSGPFVAMGHSQGGQAAWAFAERLIQQPIDGYKGTVAIAPPSNLILQAEQAMHNLSQPWAQGILSAQPKLIAAVTAAFPVYSDSGMTDVSYNRWHNVFKPLKACLPTDTLVFSDLQLKDLAKANWTSNETVQKYARMAATGRRKFKGPLLILAGESDVVVPLQTIESSVQDTCTMLERGSWGESLEMVTYGGMNHFPVIQASQMKWLSWVKDRLSSKGQGTPGCVKSAVNGFRTQFTPQVPFPNFLEHWASPDEAWKYLL